MKKLPPRFIEIFLSAPLMLAVTVLGFYIYDQHTANSAYADALSRELPFRDEFKSDDLRYQEIQTEGLGGGKYKTRVILVQNFNYFENVLWFSLSGRSKDFPEDYSAILFYEYNPNKQEYEQVYKFIPFDVAQEHFLPGAKEQDIEEIPLLLTWAGLGDIDNDSDEELVTEWSYCNFNHCVWSYPIIIGYDKGYYVEWAMPTHELSKHDLNGDYWWGGQKYERKVVNTYDGRKYVINGGNKIEYKILDNEPVPYIVSYNIDSPTCWACGHTYLLDLFSLDGGPIKAQHTFHKTTGLENHFTTIKDFKFTKELNLLE